MEFIESKEMCRFHSRLNELPLSLKRDIALVTLQDGWNNIKRREEIINYLCEHNIDFVDIGTGTNRFIVKYDGYVIKIALDDEGVNDNKQEWNIGFQLPRLDPNFYDVALPYEISKGGHLLVADYAPAFTSYNEMTDYKDTILGILKNWFDAGYLLGDIGLQSKNYANWGLFNGRPVCIDYAYVFRASGVLFTCSKCGGINLNPDTYYTKYVCQRCKKEIPDAFLRAKINDNMRSKLFQQSLNEDFTLTMEDVECEKECIVQKETIKNEDAPDRNQGFINAYTFFKNKGGF